MREVYIYIYRYTSEARRRALARCGAWLRGGCPRLRFVGNARSITRALSYLSLYSFSLSPSLLERAALARERLREGRFCPRKRTERGAGAPSPATVRAFYFSLSLSVCIRIYLHARSLLSRLSYFCVLSAGLSIISLSLVSVADATDERRRGREGVEIIIRIVSRFFVVDNVARKEREESLKKMGG